MDKYTRDNLAQLREWFRAEIEGLSIEHYGGTMVFYPLARNAPEADVSHDDSKRHEESDLPFLLV